MQKTLIKFIPFLIMASFLTTGCTQTGTTSAKIIPQHGTSSGSRNLDRDYPIYMGNVSNVSNKAKVIAIDVGKGAAAKTILVKFDDKTKGIEHAVVGHASIIHFEMRGGEPWATVIKAKLAKLPDGVTEIKTAELKSMLDKDTKFTLVDARPANRAVVGSLPGAINIPSDDFKNQSNKLPENKDELLVIFCGGPT